VKVIKKEEGTTQIIGEMNVMNDLIVITKTTGIKNTAIETSIGVVVIVVIAV